ncbi:MAG: DNA repair protein RecO [Thermoleophilia bacterium]|nr:DNA repair protein RecO [Thermoleophilia bacterium]
MAESYATEAIVLGSRRLGEADRIVDLFTDSRGRVPTVVKGIRKVKSRWGGRLEPFTHLRVQVHEGRNLHTLTSADTIATHAALRDNPACLKPGLSVIEMISRTTPEHHRKPRTYNLMLSFLNEMDRICLDAGSGRLTSLGAGSKGESAPSSNAPHEAAAPDRLRSHAASLALGAQLKILLLAGFLPHLLSCAMCGAKADLTSFSARAGGALCPGCLQDGFRIDPGSLEAMILLLERPLSAVPDLKIGEVQRRQIRRAVREICEYHLGVRLRVEL